MKLNKAIEKGDIEATKQAIADGANVNAKNRNYRNETPLHKVISLLNSFSALPGHKKIAELLIASGADVNARMQYEVTPLHDASCADSETVELLLANGADVNAKRADGNTPLLCAAFNGHAENAELLIAAGADVNAKDNEGETPLDLADNKEMADLLRKHGGKRGKELKAEGN